jgi:hypothetical protein
MPAVDIGRAYCRCLKYALRLNLGTTPLDRSKDIVNVAPRYTAGFALPEQRQDVML